MNGPVLIATGERVITGPTGWSRESLVAGLEKPDGEQIVSLSDEQFEMVQKAVMEVCVVCGLWGSCMPTLSLGPTMRQGFLRASEYPAGSEMDGCELKQRTVPSDSVGS